METLLTFKQVKQPDRPRWRDETGQYEIFISEAGNWHVTWQGIHFVTANRFAGAVRAANDQ